MLMPDHVHFFAQASPDSDRMSDWVRMWKSVSAQQITKVLDVVPPVWQEDYFDRYLRSAESYAQKWQYVRNNPVRAGLVQCPEDWPYPGQICELFVS